MHPKDSRSNDLSALHSSTTKNATDPVHVLSPCVDADAVSVTANDALLLPPTTLQAVPGQVVALRGENGSGKTTLLRALAGRIKPTTGTIHVSGQPVNERDPEFRRRVAVMIGLPPMASDLTVFDHVALVSSTWERSPGSVEAVTRRVLDEFGLTVLVLAGMSLSIPEMFTFTPWGWVGVTYPLGESSVLSLVGVTVLAAAFIVMTPVLLNRLTGMQLRRQAAQWERAAAFSFSFDFRAATSVYEAEPHLGRNIRAINPSKQRWVTFFLRDALGQARMPGRSLGAVTATAAAGALMTLSFLPGTSAALLAGTAGIVVYSATGPLTKGLQHAASVAGDYPLYGISDRHLVLLHASFPLMTLIAVLTTSAAITAFASGAALGLPLAGAAAVGALTLALRLSNALKGPLPPSLLAPVNTPAVDLSVVMQIGWAISEPMIAICGALTVTMLPTTPIPLVMVAVGVGMIVLVRWKKRR